MIKAKFCSVRLSDISFTLSMVENCHELIIKYISNNILNIYMYAFIINIYICVYTHNACELTVQKFIFMVKRVCKAKDSSRRFMERDKGM